MKLTRMLGAAVAASLLIQTGSDARTSGTAAGVVLAWNQILQDTIPGPGGALAPRFHSLTHIAMFDAINAIEREFEPYHVDLRRSGGSSAAAAAQAAHDVITALNPAAA